METKICLKCHEEKPVEEFNWRSKKKGTKQPRCKVCTRTQIRGHYEENKKYYVDKARRFSDKRRKQNRKMLLDYFSEHACVDCDETDPRCLTFDHVRGKKTMNVSQMVGDFSWMEIQKEIQKCEVRCANCHMKKTADEFGWYTSKTP